MIHIKQHHSDPSAFVLFVYERDLPEVWIGDILPDSDVNYTTMSNACDYLIEIQLREAASAIDNWLEEWVRDADTEQEDFRRITDDIKTAELSLFVGKTIYFRNKSDAMLFKLQYAEELKAA